MTSSTYYTELGEGGNAANMRFTPFENASGHTDPQHAVAQYATEHQDSKSDANHAHGLRPDLTERFAGNDTSQSHQDHMTMGAFNPSVHPHSYQGAELSAPLGKPHNDQHQHQQQHQQHQQQHQEPIKEPMYQEPPVVRTGAQNGAVVRVYPQEGKPIVKPGVAKKMYGEYDDEDDYEDGDGDGKCVTDYVKKYWWVCLLIVGTIVAALVCANNAKVSSAGGSVIAPQRTPGLALNTFGTSFAGLDDLNYL
jgi:hypothetical protein